jgi:hypothetical protein
MWFKVIPFTMLLLSCQFLFSQETKPKNPILTDKFIISAGLYSPLNNVSFSVNGTAIDRESENIDFDEYFNLDDFQNTFSLTFTWRFAKNWNLSADYFRITRQNDVVLKEDIQWRDVTFRKGTGVEGGFGFALYRVFVGRVIARGNHYEIGGGLGVHTINISPFIEGQAYINDQDFEIERHEVSTTLPLPNIGLWIIYAPTPKLSVSAKIDWFGIKIDNVSGSLWDITPTINYQVFRNVGISAGYKYLNFGIDIDMDRWQGGFGLQFQGPTLSIFGNF